MEERQIPIAEADYHKYLEVNKDAWQKFEAGELDSKGVQRERFEAFAAHLGRDITEGQALNDHYVENLGRQAILMDGVTEMLQQLRAHYKLAVATNGLTLVQRERLKRSGFLPLLDEVFISQEMGVQKPHKAYYDHIMSKFGQEDCAKYLMIGDSFSADIQGGINAGIDTCWYQNPGALPDETIQPTYTVRGYDELLRLLLP
jgi:YjjG family noncanonical pyrimidine nucleotidase